MYQWVAFESPIPDIAAELIGPNVKFHHSKLNLKGGRVGPPVEWHQDAAFYPHSNDDVLVVGLLLDDATAENACLAVPPGSHRERVHEHYDDGGRSIGRMRDEDIGRFDDRKGQLLELPTGSQDAIFWRRAPYRPTHGGRYPPASRLQHGLEFDL